MSHMNFGEVRPPRLPWRRRVPYCMMCSKIKKCSLVLSSLLFWDWTSYIFWVNLGQGWELESSLFLLHEPSDHTIHSWQADDVGVFTPPQKLIICISRSRIRRQYLVQIKSPCPWYILNPNSSKRTFWEPWPVKNGESEAGCWVLLGYVFAINDIYIYIYLFIYLFMYNVYIWIYPYIYRVNIVHYNTYLNTILINTYMCIRMILKHVKRPIGWCLSLVIGRPKARQLSHAQWRGVGGHVFYPGWFDQVLSAVWTSAFFTCRAFVVRRCPNLCETLDLGMPAIQPSQFQTGRFGHDYSMRR